jgi:hypothetical protein
MQEDPAVATALTEKWSQRWQYLLDKASPHLTVRWISFTIIFAIYFVRVFLIDGWFIVTYGLGIYLLNQFIGFLSPQVTLFKNKNNLRKHYESSIFFLSFVCSLILRKMTVTWVCLQEKLKNLGMKK